MLTIQPSLEDQNQESKLFFWPEHINDDVYGIGF